MLARSIELDSFSIANGTYRELENSGHLSPSFLQENFDLTTLFYHVYLKNGYIFCIGPKLKNFQRLLPKIEFSCCGLRLEPKIIKYKRIDLLRFKMPTKINSEVVFEVKDKVNCKSFILKSDGPISEIFRNKRVLVTVNKNNSLAWIRSWVEFHRDRYNVDHILFFDNGSEVYTLDKLQSFFQELHVNCVVIGVPFKYGALLPGRDHSGQFLQTALLTIAKDCFLSRATSVLSVDIDEYVYDLSANTNIFERTERSFLGLIRFSGQWVYTAPDCKGSVGFSDHIFYDEADSRCPDKYCYSPAGIVRHLPLDAHGLHIEKGWKRFAFHFLSKWNTFYFRHCWSLTTSWKGKREVKQSGLKVIESNDFQAIVKKNRFFPL